MGAVEVIKSPSDKKLYRRIDLDNGLAALLIYDHEVALAQQAKRLKPKEDDEADEDDDGDDEDEDGDEDGEQDEEEEGSQGGPAGMKKAAAALAVGVGSFCDPKDMQGLSHYLEHMLFMGSQKFPKENEYDEYLTAHAGSSNAFTEWEATNYYLDVDPSAFHGALDRLSQCLSAPLCSQSALEREVNAVNNEFIGCLQHDTVRVEQLMARTARPGHVAQAFSWGNKLSLWDQPTAAGIPIRERLLAYYRQHYSAERMNLVLLGGEPLDVMEEWVRDLFKDLPRGRGPRPCFSHLPPPFEGRNMYVMGAVKDQHQISLTFQFPNLDAYYKKKAGNYISHLLGHEGSGSLLSLLKAKGWATELTAGIDEGGFGMNSVGYLFQITITLTQAGLHESPGLGLAPVAVAIQYISMLQATEPQEWVWQELKGVAEMNFRFAEETDPCEMVRDLATNLHLYAPQDPLVADSLYEDWDPALIKKLLDCMSVDTTSWRIDLLTKAFEELQPQLEAWPGSSYIHEPWFDIKAALMPLSDEQVKEWKHASVPPELHLPPRNDYIASDFALRAPPSETPGPATDPTSRPPASPPQLLKDEAGLRVWHKLDHTFATPRTCAYFVLASPLMHSSPGAAARAHLLLKLLEEALTEDAYLADVAGLHYHTSPEGSVGLEIKVEGFSHKLPVLTQRIFKALTNLQVSEASWKVVHEALVRKYRNMHMSPWSHATYLRLLALVAHHHPTDEVLAELETLKFSDVQDFIKQVLSNCHLECLLMGNLTATEAEQLAASVHTLLGPGAKLLADERVQGQLVQLQPGHIYVHQHPAKDPENRNAAMELYLQAEPCNDPKQRALVDAIEQIISEPLFNVLRTQEQLGYRVNCGTRLTVGVMGLCIWIVSGVYPTEYLDQRAEAFLQYFATVLESLTSEEFSTHVSSVVSNKLQLDRNLAEEADKHWQPIMSRRYDFASKEEEVQELQKLTLAEVQAWWSKYASPSSLSRRKLSIRVNPQCEQNPVSAPMDTVTTAEVPAKDTAAPMETEQPAAEPGRATTETEMSEAAEQAGAATELDKKAAQRIPDAKIVAGTKVSEVADLVTFRQGMPLYPAGVLAASNLVGKVAAAAALMGAGAKAANGLVGANDASNGEVEMEEVGSTRTAGVKRGREGTAT